MKKIVCEMCGSNEFIKDGNYFVCQMCGTKYTPEDAKKMMIEGTVEVRGKVEVDQSEFVQKCLQNARRALSKQDWEEVEKYYNMVEMQEPSNIEAIFYSSYGKAKMAMVESDRFKREQKMQVLQNSLSIIDDNYDTNPAKYEENKQLIQQINRDLLELMEGSFVYTRTTTNGVSYNDSAYTIRMFEKLSLAWIESIQNIIDVLDEEESFYFYGIIRSQYYYLYSNSKPPQKRYYQEKVLETDEKLHMINEFYTPPASVAVPKAVSGQKTNLDIFVNIFLTVTISVFILILIICYFQNG